MKNKKKATELDNRTMNAKLAGLVTANSDLAEELSNLRRSVERLNKLVAATIGVTK